MDEIQQWEIDTENEIEGKYEKYMEETTREKFRTGEKCKGCGTPIQVICRCEVSRFNPNNHE